LSNKFKVFNKIDTVHGVCEECQEETILVAIVSEYYRCVNCGSDTRQHINGSIRYLRLNERDKKFIKEHGREKRIRSST
jgi:hypothetical protein|tara:strand:+ start:47 stop:283 length:237 start_codon:yes stop_codon:yes gene_type:complete